MASDKKETEPNLGTAQVPLSGEQRDVAYAEMDKPGFLNRLTVRIMKLAARKGFFSPFDNEIDLPGGKAAGDLAIDVIERALDGSYTWDTVAHPSFEGFCLSRAESILSNWLAKNSRQQSFSPIIEEDEVSDAPQLNPVNTAADPVDIYGILRLQDGGSLGDKFLQDFALELPESSLEQRIAMEIFDDRQCTSRPYCMAKLALSEGDYDAAVKRLKRRAREFKCVWLKANNITPEDWKEIR